MACIFTIKGKEQFSDAPPGGDSRGEFYDGNWCHNYVVVFTMSCTGRCVDTSPCPEIPHPSWIHFEVPLCLDALEDKINEDDGLFDDTLQDYKDLEKAAIGGGGNAQDRAHSFNMKHIRPPVEDWLSDESNYQDIYDLYTADIIANGPTLCKCGSSSSSNNPKLLISLQDGIYSKQSKMEFS